MALQASSTKRVPLSTFSTLATISDSISRAYCSPKSSFLENAIASNGVAQKA